MPNSIILLDIKPTGVSAELQLPLTELELAFGQNLTTHPETVVNQFGPQLQAYFLQHIHPTSPENRPWNVAVKNMKLQSVAESANGPYQELIVQLWFAPPSGASSRTFTLNYDVIIHQLVTHSALVSIRQDWEAGILAQQPVEVGIIRLDIVSNKILPLEINQKEANWWKGFKSMVQLGTQHIAEGTDHLLFLLVLLLPAPLLVFQKRWGAFGGLKYSLEHLLKVVTAFTIGHSITLLVGALGWLRLPGQPVEILIAFSILVSAVHAMRPIFPGREAYVAAGFGLIHGMAFAGTLANLNLEPTYMALSILGFNIGIELMQLLVIIMVVPGLILISKTTAYKRVRIIGAVLAGVAALAWIVERSTGKVNFISIFVEKAAKYSIWFTAALAIFSLGIYIVTLFRNRNARLISAVFANESEK